MTTVGLEAAVEEVASGPDGPSVGAFFDFDGTLIAGYSAMHISQERVRTRDVSVTEVARTLAVGVQAGLGRAGFEDLLGVGATAWKGREDADLRAMGERVFERRINDLVYPEARELVLAHRDRGHTVVLSSSATEYQVEPMARYLGVEHVVCNRYTKEHGRLTGSLEQPVIWGPTKAGAVEAFALDHGIDLTASWFYADGDEDVALMRVVGHPRPTNPSRGLAGVAANESWPTLRFTSRSPRASAGRVKQVASAAALVAATAGGGVVAAARRDRQAGANFVTQRWLSAVFAINGVQVQVQGEEHLEAPRPAVFVYNHRNNIDGFIAASLVAHDFVSVGDQEVADNRMVALLAQLSGITFLPRDDAHAPPHHHAPRGDDGGGSVGPHRSGGRAHRHHHGRAVRGRCVPRRHRGRSADRAHRHPQRRSDRRSQRINDGEWRRRRDDPSADRKRSLDPRDRR